MSLWGGRFKDETDPVFEKFNASIAFDCRLLPYDIRGSIAHARMLGKTGIIPADESQLLVETLEAILKAFADGTLQVDYTCEDVHSFVEAQLIERIGDVGKKLHTGRSRNDQVALDIKLYLKDEMTQLQSALKDLTETLQDLSSEHSSVVMPGYTHLQRAQPILFSQHVLAYYEMFNRDITRVEDAYARLNVSPLGSGALAGTTFSIDREMVAEELGFSSVTRNTLDAVSDRDHVIEVLSIMSILMMHMSRFCEELILWSSQEFGFIEMSDAYSTGSSMMPQKKNPDAAELIRGKTGRVYGNLVSMLTTMKALPLAYNKDMQEDKEPLFDSVETVQGCVRILNGMVKTMHIRPDAMKAAAEQGYANATDVAEYLVARGVPFRDAHAVVGKLVLYAIEKQSNLTDLKLDEFVQFSPSFDESIYSVLALGTGIAMRSEQIPTKT